MASPNLFLAALASLFLVHVGLRLLTSPIAAIDESWQIVLSQKWALGYTSHPPLYTWLQIIFFKVFGESIFALALLKNTLLFALYAFTYTSARLLTRQHAHAVFATLCLFLIPQISWESQRDLTHSVLLSTMIAGTLCAFLSLAEKETSLRYALLGLGTGLALLSKYNAAVFLAGFTLAAMMVPRYRALLLKPRTLIAIAVCVAVALPHYIWVAQNAGHALAGTRKLDFGHFDSWGTAALHMPWLMAKAALPNLVPLVIAYGLARPNSPFRLRTDAARLVFWGIVLSLSLLTIVMIAVKGSGLRGRWFQALFVCAPILLVAQLSEIPRYLFRLVWGLALTGIVAILVLLPWNANRGAGQRNQDLMPYTLNEIAASARDIFAPAGLIIAEDFWLGGNMKLMFRRPVVTPLAAWKEVPSPARILVVFNASTSVGSPGTELEFAL